MVKTQALAEHGLALPQIPPRYPSTHFEHIVFGGYSATAPGPTPPCGARCSTDTVDRFRRAGWAHARER